METILKLSLIIVLIGFLVQLIYYVDDDDDDDDGLNLT